MSSRSLWFAISLSLAVVAGGAAFLVVTRSERPRPPAELPPFTITNQATGGTLTAQFPGIALPPLPGKLLDVIPAKKAPAATPADASAPPSSPNESPPSPPKQGMAAPPPPDDAAAAAPPATSIPAAANPTPAARDAAAPAVGAAGAPAEPGSSAGSFIAAASPATRRSNAEYCSGVKRWLTITAARARALEDKSYFIEVSLTGLTAESVSLMAITRPTGVITDSNRYRAQEVATDAPVYCSDCRFRDLPLDFAFDKGLKITNDESITITFRCHFEEQPAARVTLAVHLALTRIGKKGSPIGEEFILRCDDLPVE